MDDFGMGELDAESAPPQTQEREHVPQGVHEFQVVRVTNQDYGFDLALQHDEKRYGLVIHRLDRARDQTVYRARELRNALAISLEEWRGMDPTELIHRRVRAEIRHKVGNDGRLWVNVWKYMPTIEYAGQPAQAQPKPAAPARKTPAQQVKEASPAVAQHDDDIPF